MDGAASSADPIFETRRRTAERRDGGVEQDGSDQFKFSIAKVTGSNSLGPVRSNQPQLDKR